MTPAAEPVTEPVTELVTAACVVADGRVYRPGWLALAGERVQAYGAGKPPESPDHTTAVQRTDLGEAIVVPGFVDTHVHGGGGGTFPAGTREDTARAVGLHLAHGTTTMIASLVAASPAALLRLTGELAGHVEESASGAQELGAGALAGVHLEGPWIASGRCGAHDPTAVRDPDPAELEAVLAAGRGTVRMVTLAPERPGGIEAIRRCVDAGVVAAIGHTDATYDQTVAGIEAGARVATHLFNAMRPMHQREPGPIAALTEDPRVTVELIADGVHVHPAMYRLIADRVGAGTRASLITDAMAAAGESDGRYRLGTLEVEVIDGRACLVDTLGADGRPVIAASTATMDVLFRFALEHGGQPPEAGLLAAVAQTSTTPARALGLPDEHALGVGHRADLVVLTPDHRVARVRRGARWVR